MVDMRTLKAGDTVVFRCGGKAVVTCFQFGQDYRDAIRAIKRGEK